MIGVSGGCSSLLYLIEVVGLEPEGFTLMEMFILLRGVVWFGSSVGMNVNDYLTSPRLTISVRLIYYG